ncbi:MAG: hypothetical protein GYA17_18125 [Chloroflexi bacterium]|jgi:hypothetical protein|nr:hypothetical protein [Anaerolineaceae bacterium]NMB90282.1 hypothetical protein [Chloroflexota bacterium]
MAKKQKRQVNRSYINVSSQAEASAPASSASSRSAANVEFNPDYSYVIQDLKRIGILAVSFIGILVVLSFFLR